MSDRELVLIALQGLPQFGRFITTISNNDKFLSFDELVGKCTQEETRMISRGRIQKHEEGKPCAFAAQDKKRKGKGRPSSSRKPAPESKDFKRKGRKIECFNCHKHGHYARDCSKKRDVPRSNYNHGYNNKKFNDRRRRDDGRRRDNRRRRDAPNDREEGHHPQKRSRNSRYGNNVVATQSEYILISAFSSSSPSDLFDGW